MLYRIQSDTTTPTINGRNLAHAHRSIPERAFVAAGLHLNRLALTSPTVKQAARLAGVCARYAAGAIDIIDDPDACDAVLHGGVCILDAAKRPTVRESLADHIRRSTPEELAAAARATGSRTSYECSTPRRRSRWLTPLRHQTGDRT